MSPVRRAAAPPPPPQESGEALDIFNLQSYYGGKTIPEGDYAIEFVAKEGQSTNAMGQAVGKPRVGVELVLYPLQGGDPIDKFLSLGSKALASWVPNSTGKGFAKRAGGPGLPPTNKSNWVVFLNSLIQCGLPIDQLKGNDFSALDGLWAHIKEMPEPEERKMFKTQAATGESAGEQGDDEPKGNGLVPTCLEILEGGKPWEGGGGFTTAPAAAPARPAAAAPRRAPAAAPATVAAPVARRAPVSAPPPPPVEEGESVEDAALQCISDAILESPKGIKRMKLRMRVHEIALAKYDEQTATDIVNGFVANETALANVLGSIDYKISGAGPQAEIVPVA